MPLKGTLSAEKVLPLSKTKLREFLEGLKVNKVLPDEGVMYVQCPLDIQTTLRRQGHGRYSQRGRFIKRLDIATWRPLY